MRHSPCFSAVKVYEAAYVGWTSRSSHLGVVIYTGDKMNSEIMEMETSVGE